MAMVRNKKAMDYFLQDLPYSEEDAKLGMVCTTAGFANVPPGTEYPPRKNDYSISYRTVTEGRILPEFQMVYVTSGEGIFKSGGASYQVKPGSLMLLLPGTRHAYSPRFELGWYENWVGFKGSYFSGLMEEGYLSPENAFFEPGLHDSILSIYNHIFEEAQALRPLCQMKACASILFLISEVLTRERQKEQPSHCEEIVAKAKYLMESNIYNVINIADISGQLGLCPSRFNEIFKAYTSMTPYQYFINIKIHKAEHILEHEEISVKEAAYKMGFDDQYYFSRLFKKKTGVSPSNWKKPADR